MSNGEFTQLSFSSSKPEISDDLGIDDIMEAMSFSRKYVESLSDESQDDIVSQFRRARGVLFDESVNDHGFAQSGKALSYMESHFKKTKDVGYLHNFFKDHDFMSVDAMLGRQTELKFVKSEERMYYNALLSNKHPLVQRAELMKSVSGTIIRGGLECVKCGDPYTGNFFPEPTCDHMANGKDIYPITHKAIHIETSFVTFPAYKKTSVEMFKNSSSLASQFRPVLESEFPDSPYLKSDEERAELLASLQGNIMLDDHEDEDNTSSGTTETIKSLMAEMRKLASERAETLSNASSFLPHL